MSRFFVGWKIWEKLVFILACSMVITISVGSIKLLHAHWKLRKLSKIGLRDAQDNMNQNMNRRMKRWSGRHVEDIPFGIRALESGIEVEGVWISPGNSPDMSRACSLSDQTLAKRYEVDLKKQKPSRTNGRPPEPTQGKAERMRYPPSSYAKYGPNPYFMRQSSSARTLEGLDAIYKASTSIHGDDNADSSESSKGSNRSSADVGPIFASAPSLLMSSQREAGAAGLRSTSDLDLLNSHRVSQAAETGQFTPRGRYAFQRRSVDETGNSRQGRHSIPVDATPVATTSATNKVSALPPAVRRSSMPDVTPFAEFCKRVSQDARPQTVSTKSSHASTDSIFDDCHSPSSLDSEASEPIMPASAGAAEMKLPPPMPGSFEKRASQIMRGHGTGFEILKPGSLKPAVSSEKQDIAPKQKNAPPVSLQNVFRTSEDGTNKLQKKRRPSNDCGSSTHSRRSRISLFA